MCGDQRALIFFKMIVHLWSIWVTVRALPPCVGTARSRRVGSVLCRQGALAPAARVCVGRFGLSIGRPRQPPHGTRQDPPKAEPKPIWRAFWRNGGSAPWSLNPFGPQFGAQDAAGRIRPRRSLRSAKTPKFCKGMLQVADASNGEVVVLIVLSRVQG